MRGEFLAARTPTALGLSCSTAMTTVWLRGVLSARKVSFHVIDDLYAGAVETLASWAPHAVRLIDGVRLLLALRGTGASASGVA